MGGKGNDSPLVTNHLCHRFAVTLFFFQRNLSDFTTINNLQVFSLGITNIWLNELIFSLCIITRQIPLNMACMRQRQKKRRSIKKSV